MKYLLIPILATTAVNSYANTQQCSEITSCIELVSGLTGKKYLLDKDIKGKIQLTKNFKITKDNADEFIAYTLYMNGYTRIPYNGDEWSVINARDVRYSPAPVYTYGKDNIPATYDYVTTNIKLKNPFIASELARNFRPFMSRYGRVIDLKDPGMLIINDTGKNVHRLIQIIEQVDKKPTKEEIEIYQAEQKNRQKKQLIEAKNCSSVNQELKEVKQLIMNSKNN